MQETLSFYDLFPAGRLWGFYGFLPVPEGFEFSRFSPGTGARYTATKNVVKCLIQTPLPSQMCLSSSVVLIKRTILMILEEQKKVL